MRALVLCVSLVGLVGCPEDPPDPPPSSTEGESSSTTSTDSSTGADGTTSTGSDASSTGPVPCDPPCEAGQQCVDGTCMNVACEPECDPATEECIDGMCVPLPPTSDYGPCDACAEGELPVTVVGVEGCFCSPACETDRDCPGPSEGAAMPLCLLAIVEGDPPTQCALVCTKDMDCPPGATCQRAGEGNICLHPGP